MKWAEADGTGTVVRIAFRHSRNADGQTCHGTCHDNPDYDHGSDLLRFVQRAAERHDLQCQQVAEVVEHCDIL